MTSYEPETDGAPDPGEVVWAWVPYEDDPARGKDRPVLLISRKDVDGPDEGDGVLWAGLMLSSQDHDRDEEQEAAAGRHWMDVGVGDWDREGRPSEVRLDRLIVLADADIRREGAALDRATFDRVVAEARRWHAIE
ncbi:type II toxin-antitoxin system PemK/MazF family toxin [Nocardioides dilutus]